MLAVSKALAQLWAARWELYDLDQSPEQVGTQSSMCLCACCTVLRSANRVVFTPMHEVWDAACLGMLHVHGSSRTKLCFP